MHSRNSCFRLGDISYASFQIIVYLAPALCGGKYPDIRIEGLVVNDPRLVYPKTKTNDQALNQIRRSNRKEAHYDTIRDQVGINHCVRHPQTQPV